MNSMKRYRLLAVTILAALLSACTVTIHPGNVAVRGRVHIGIDLANIITHFAPSRGEGSTYYVGENVSFEVRTNQTGYITLTAIDPDGCIYTFIRNIYVQGGVTRTIPGPADRVAFTLQPPRGVQRVRASFTPTPTSGSVSYSGCAGADVWTQSIVTEIQPYPADARDVAQTYFYLR